VAAVAAVAAIVFAAAGVLDVLAAGLGVICCALVAAVSGYAIWQGERALRSRLADERTRVARIRAAQESQLFAWQAEHAARVREWQALRVAYDHQKRWYAVCAPDGVHRVDVAGGTLSGWSAMLATAGAYRLAAGGEVTVLDLTEGSVALDLLGFARTSGIDPLVWVLPADLPRLDLGTGLSQHAWRSCCPWWPASATRTVPRVTSPLITPSSSGSSTRSGARRPSPVSRPPCGRWPRPATRATTWPPA
jgi:hypothetical protein